MKNITYKLFVITLLSLFSIFSMSQDVLTLEGPDVIHYDYPDDFIEKSRKIRIGIKTGQGDCDFTTTLRAKPGEQVMFRELAYDPATCESLYILGISETKYQNKYDFCINRQEETFVFSIASSSSGPTVSANLHTWYEDPIFIDVNSVESQIDWAPDSACTLIANTSAGCPIWLSLTKDDGARL